MKQSAFTVMLILMTPAGLAAQAAVPLAPESGLTATAASVPVAVPAPVQTISAALPANTEIAVSPVANVSSKKLKKGDSFAIETIADVMHQGFVVIPRGAQGQATISKRSGKGVFGRSAKLEYSVDWIALADGRKLPVNGNFDSEGKQNVTALAGGMFMAGLLGGLLVTGRSAEVPAGHILYVRSAEGVAYSVAPDAQPLTIVTLIPRPERAAKLTSSRPN